MNAEDVLDYFNFHHNNKNFWNGIEDNDKVSKRFADVMEITHRANKYKSSMNEL